MALIIASQTKGEVIIYRGIPSTPIICHKHKLIREVYEHYSQSDCYTLLW